jgi:hypothetical protein
MLRRDIIVLIGTSLSALAKPHTENAEFSSPCYIRSPHLNPPHFFNFIVKLMSLSTSRTVKGELSVANFLVNSFKQTPLPDTCGCATPA